MRAIRCLDGPGFELVELPEPAPPAGGLLLQVEACGLCGTDLFKLEHGTAPGAVLGHELVGRVIELGVGTDPSWLGARLAVPHHAACDDCELCLRGSETMCPTFKENLLDPGGFAERLALPARALETVAWRLPEHLDERAALFLEPAACVLRALDRGGVDERPGLWIVAGGGSMGLLFLTTLLALDPTHRVVISEPDPARQRRALELGATAAVEPASLPAAIAEVDAGRGADAAFDCVGGPRVLDQLLGVLRPGGSVVLFAHARPGEVAGFDLNRLFKSEQRVVAAYSGGLGEQRRIARLLAEGRLDPRPIADLDTSFDDFAAAVEAVRQRRAYKAVLRP